MVSKSLNSLMAVLYLMSVPAGVFSALCLQHEVEVATVVSCAGPCQPTDRPELPEPVRSIEHLSGNGCEYTTGLAPFPLFASFSETPCLARVRSCVVDDGTFVADDSSALCQPNEVEEPIIAKCVVIDGPVPCQSVDGSPLPTTVKSFEPLINFPSPFRCVYITDDERSPLVADGADLCVAGVRYCVPALGTGGTTEADGSSGTSGSESR